MAARIFRVWTIVLLTAAGARAGEPLQIRVDPEGWGESSPADMEQVVRSAAQTLWVHFEGAVDPIRISRSPSGPIVLYRRDESGAYRVRLDTQDRRWAQLAYQFAHEFCHILCRYREAKNGNAWFEEMLCELASLYALRRMSETWETAPPYPVWKDYAPALRRYAQQRLEEHPLPEGFSLPAWYVENEAALRRSATDRGRNTFVAARLLPLFEGEPSHWAAVSFLNEGGPAEGESLNGLFGRWEKAAPEKHRPFIRRIAAQFFQEQGTP